MNREELKTVLVVWDATMLAVLIIIFAVILAVSTGPLGR
jgi:hypothetical protein